MNKIIIRDKRLLELRIKKGLTIKQLNEMSGIHIAVISRTENGKSSPSPTTAKKICEALGVDFDELFEIAYTKY